MLLSGLSNRFRSLPLSLRFCFCSLFLALGLTSCRQALRAPPMQARLERVDPSYLASSQINTPNIGGCCFAGEQVVVHWSLPSECSNLTGTFTVRYKDYTESTIDFAVRRNKGYWIYRLIGEGFCEKGGVLSYKAEIFANNALIAETRHHLYANTITLDEC